MYFIIYKANLKSWKVDNISFQQKENIEHVIVSFFLI